MSAFAREHGLNPQRLRYWRDQVATTVGQAQARTRRPGRRPARAGKLVPGVVVSSAPVSVYLALGVIVHAQSAQELEPAWIAELVRALEQLS